VASAYIALLKADKNSIHNEAFNVGQSSENFRVLDLAILIENANDKFKIIWAENASPDKRCYRVDCNKIARSIHEYKPQWTVQRGIQQLLQGYKSIQLNAEDIEGTKYSRINHVKELIEKGVLSSQLIWKNSKQTFII